MKGFGDYPGLGKYFDSDDEIPDLKKTNKPKR